jgi:putative ATP-dependent endonuclease of OLD family
MRISRLRIENFRSIRQLDVELGDSTVFIGANNAGKTAILDAVRIVLTRRWGQRGTGFTEHDVHKPDEVGDPRTLPPVTITLILEEPQAGAWDADMVAALEDIMAVLQDGRSILTLRVTCGWNAETEAFDPVWQFLDAAGQPLPERRLKIPWIPEIRAVRRERRSSWLVAYNDLKASSTCLFCV